MFRKLNIIITLAFLMIAGNTQAAHVYWKPNTGSDSNTGTSTSSAVKTLSKAILVLKAQYEANPNPSPDWIIIQMESWVIGASENGEIVIDGKIDDTHNALVLREPSMRDYMIKYLGTTNSGSNTLKLGSITFHGNSVKNSWSAGNGNQNNPIIVIGAGRTLIMEGGCVLTENQHTHPATEILNGAGVVINGGGTLVMNGGEISKCKSNNYGGGVYGQNGATFIMNGGKIDNCFAAGTANYGESNAHPRGSGGGIYLSAGSTMTMTGGEISNCTAYQFGGGVKVQGSTDNQTIVTITKCNVHHCIADGPQDNYGRGGGFDFGSNVEVTIDGPEVLIHNNNCQCYGGGIQLQGGPVVYFKNGKIYENKAIRTLSEDAQLCGAAGIHTTSNSQFIMSGGEVYGNYTPGVGGAIHSSYEGTMEITGGKLYNNHAAFQGGAINLNTNCHLRIPDGSTVEMYGNTAGRGGAVCCDAANVWIYDGSFHDNHAVDTVQTNTQKGFGGAFELVMEQTQEGYEFRPSNMYIYGGEIYNNTASVDGGAIHMKKNAVTPTAGIPTMRIQGGEIHDNIAYKGNGGAIFADDQTTFYMEPNTEVTPATEGAIYDNESKLGSGGAVYLGNAEVYISAGSFANNQAHLDGGGFYLNGNTSLVKIEGGKIISNEAGSNGGGFYVNGGNITISGGNLQNNIATTGNGGGFYSADGTVSISGATVSGNHAKKGAGFYVAGTNDVTTTIQGGSTISGNIAAEDGAGAYIASGNLSILSSDVQDNTATAGNGGAIYAASGTVDMNGASVDSNSAALNGGGFFLGPKAKITLQDGSIEKNEATNGGAIYLSDGAFFEYKTSATGDPGYIRGNTASNLGGGIYLAEGTSQKTEMKFTLNSTNLGFYNNIAGKGADDIYAYGNGTTKINIPNVQSMNLGGYSLPGATLEWWEDYKVSDSRYSEGTVQGDPSNITRYRASRDADEPIWKVPATSLSSFYEKYLCLTLGFEYGKIEIRRAGLKPNENAIYEVKFGDGSQRDIQRVVVYGSDEEGIDVDNKHWNVAKVSFLPKGEYTVTEIPWTWYNEDKTTTALSKTQIISEGDGYIFNFENAHHNLTETPLHDEEFKVNILKK